MTGSGTADPNHIIDEGNPISTAGLESVIRLFELTGIDLELAPEIAAYMRGWGPEATNVVDVIETWKFLCKHLTAERRSSRLT